MAAGPMCAETSIGQDDMSEKNNAPAAAKSKPRRAWIYIAEAVLFVLLLVGLHAWQTRGLPAGPAMGLEDTSLGGQPISLSALRGRPVLVHFWATWCPVCRLEQGTINRLARDYQVLSVAMQSGADAEVREYMQQHHLNFPVLNDDDGVHAARWRIRGVPTSFILDATGRIRFVEAGYTTEAGLRLRLALAARPGAVE